MGNDAHQPLLFRPILILLGGVAGKVLRGARQAVLIIRW